MKAKKAKKAKQVMDLVMRDLMVRDLVQVQQETETDELNHRFKHYK